MAKTPGSAAFFDLDRTLIPLASGPTISKALRRAGVLPERSIPGEGLAFSFFNVFGETLPSIFLTRQGARAAKGWPAEAVREAGVEIANELQTQIEPFARATVDEHREAGRRLVLATTTPYDVIKPLADLLEFDDVLATRYRVGPDGAYDGTIDGSSSGRWARLDRCKPGPEPT